MGRKLTTAIALRETESVQPVSFLAGTDVDDLPKWAQERVEGKEHLFVERDFGASHGEIVQPPPREQRRTSVHGVNPQIDREPARTDLGNSVIGTGDGVTEGSFNPDAAPDFGKPGQTEESGDEDGEPSRPKGNASRPEWAAYANEQGVPITEDMSRDDIKKAVADALDR